MTDLQNVQEQQQSLGRLDEAREFPKVVLLDTISYCNLLCSMCCHKEMQRKKGLMSWELFTRLIDEIAEKRPDARVWLVFFGEALIRKRRRPTIFEMIRYAKGKGLSDVVLNSNANLLDASAAQELIDSGLDALYVGIDAASPETYARVRVGGKYQRVVDNVLRLVELQRTQGRPRPQVHVQFVEMDENQHEKQPFIDFWKDQGVVVKIRPKVSWAGKVEAPNLRPNDAERWPCYWAMQTMSITDRGKVVTCAVDLDAGYVAADAREHSLEAIWKGPLAELRNLHLKRRFEDLPPLCRDCRDWQSARADFY